jgi:hypothetical protein
VRAFREGDPAHPFRVLDAGDAAAEPVRQQRREAPDAGTQVEDMPGPERAEPALSNRSPDADSVVGAGAAA